MFEKHIIGGQDFLNILLSDTMIWQVLCFQVREIEITETVAERSLREHKGDVVAALIELTN